MSSIPSTTGLVRRGSIKLAQSQGRAEGLYVCNDPLVTTNRAQIAALALGARLPTMFNVREFVEAGGLMSYGPSFLALYRRAGDFVDKILRGMNPADIPVEQPTRFDLDIPTAMHSPSCNKLGVATSILMKVARPTSDGPMAKAIVKRSFADRSFDEIVDTGKDRLRHGQAKGFGSLEVDDSLEADSQRSTPKAATRRNQMQSLRPIEAWSAQ